MLINQRTDVALRAAAVLAGGDAPGALMTAQALAKQAGVPRPFLEQALLHLRREGIVESRAGRRGGYRLAKEPSGVTVGDVVRAMQGTLAPLPCAATPPRRRCARAATCGLLPIWGRVREATERVVDGVTLKDLARR